MTKTRRYNTHDLALAAYLRCAGYSLLDVRREPGGRCIFAFAAEPDLDRDVRSFYDDSAIVTPLRFAESLRTLKARIYSH